MAVPDFKDLDVYRLAFTVQQRIFDLSRGLPKHEA